MEQGLLVEYRRHNKLIGCHRRYDLGDGKWFVPMFVVHPDYRSKSRFSCSISWHCKHTGKIVIQGY
ncbi:hypothetical protein OH492_29010 [Vibrio chagasii]|nr:hypothetical protein [Vibrio chagasii]